MKSIAKLFGLKKRSPVTVPPISMVQNDIDRWNHVNMNGMKKLIKFLDIQLNDMPQSHNLPVQQTIFDDIEITEDIENIIELVETDQITDIYLQSIPAIQHLTIAFKRIIITHEPIIPYSFYDHFLSPVANYEKLIHSINKVNHYFLDFVMNFLSKLVLNPALVIPSKYLAKTIGMYLLRPENISLYNRNEVDDMNHRQDVFLKLLDVYCQIQKDHQNQKLITGESPLNNQSGRGTPTSMLNQTQMQSTPAAAPAPQPPASIQDRSIKVAFQNPNNKPSQEFLKDFFGQYGNVVNIGMKEKLAVVLFTEVAPALKCAEEEVGRRLGKDFKIKYLGTKTAADLLNMSAISDISVNSQQQGKNDESLISEKGAGNEQSQLTRQRSDSASKESNLSNVPRPQNQLTGVKKPLSNHDLHDTGIAAVSSPEISTTSTMPQQQNHHNNNVGRNIEDSFRLARQPQADETLGIIDLSIISRAEDHNMTKVTLVNGETPLRKGQPPQSARKVNTANKNENSLLKTSAQRANSSFISDSGSETSDDIPLKNKQLHADSLSSMELNVEIVPKGATAGGWKTAQTNARTAVTSSYPQTMSNNSLTMSEVRRVQNFESDDESSVGGPIQPMEEMNSNKEQSRTSSKSSKTMQLDDIEPIPDIHAAGEDNKEVKSPSILKRSVKTITVGSPTHSSASTSPYQTQHSTNIQQINYGSNFPKDFHSKDRDEEEESEQDDREQIRSKADSDIDLDENDDEGTRSQRIYPVSSSQQKKLGKKKSRDSQSLPYVSSADSLTLNSIASITGKHSESNQHHTQNHLPPHHQHPTSAGSSSDKVVQHWTDNELSQRIHYLEAKCLHYETNLEQYKEIIAQNEILFKNKLISLEISNKNFIHDNKLLQQEIIHLKDQLLNQQIEIISLESIKSSLEKNLELMKNTLEKDHIVMILSQNKLIKKLENNVLIMKENNNHLNQEFQNLQHSYQENVQQLLQLKEKLIEKDLIIQSLTKREIRLSNNHNNLQETNKIDEFQQILQSEELKEEQKQKENEQLLNNSQSETLPQVNSNQQKEKEEMIIKSNFYQQKAQELSRLMEEKEKELSVLQTATKNEMKEYFAKVSPITGFNYMKQENQPTIDRIIQRSGATEKISNYYNQSESLSHAPKLSSSSITKEELLNRSNQQQQQQRQQTQSNQHISNQQTYQKMDQFFSGNQEEIEEIENLSNSKVNSVRHSQQINLNNNHSQQDNNNLSKDMSYSEKVLLKLEQQRKSSYPKQSNSLVVVSTTNKDNNTRQNNHGDQDDNKLLLPFEPSSSKGKSSIFTEKDDLFAMNNYLSELNTFGKPLPQMTYYNHLKSHLHEDIPHQNNTQPEQFASPPPAAATHVIPSAYLPAFSNNHQLPSGFKYNPPPSSSFNNHNNNNNNGMIGKEGKFLPSVYLLNEDLKSLTHSFLPAANNANHY